MKKTLSILLSIIMLVCSFAPHMAFANESTVTNEMCKASYWKAKTIVDADKVLLDFEGIAKVNQDAIDGAGTKVFDITKMAETYNANSKRDSLVKELQYDNTDKYRYRDIWVDGVKINNEEYFNNVAKAFKETCYTGEVHNTEYAVCSQYAELISYPVEGFMGWSENDTDDEKVLCGVLVNEPVVIRQKCENNGKLYYYCQTTNCSGWIDAEYLALCKDKTEWLDAWQVKLDAKNFIVLTQDKLTLEPSDRTPQVANTKVTIGSILKLVPENEIPRNIGERGTWHNYVVYFPVRNEDGTYKKDIALIAEHYNVSVGFLPLTQSNLLDVAFACLGNRYGWAGMLESFDCSMYTRTIYRCLGFELPRNTSWQPMVPHIKIDISTMTDDEKEAFIETLPAGALLYFTGHTMMYIGSEDGKNYVISATGSLSDSQGEWDVRSMYSVIINPLTARRASQNTWLHDMHSVVLPMGMTSVEDCTITATNAKTSVKLGEKELIEGLNYTVKAENGKVTFEGVNNFNGSKTVTISTPKALTLSKASYVYDGNAKKPTVIVKDNLGKTIAKSNYTVAYSNNTKVGTATVTVTFKNDYKGTLKKTFKINPKNTSGLTLAAISKGFTTKWNKHTVQTTGYQIQYATDKNFTKNVKTTTVKSNKTVSKKVTGLKSKTTYYVRIRTYKEISETKYVSSWSGYKTVKTK